MSDVGRTDDAECRLKKIKMGRENKMGVWQTLTSIEGATPTAVGRQVHMVHGGGPMGMSTDAQTGLPMCMGMGSEWVTMGNQLKRVNWTAILQAGMCACVAHVVSVALSSLNCAS